MGFVKDFKAFISRGNVVDMAVGVVVGGAFGKIVSSLVADIITPLISCATKGANLKELYYCINPNAVEGQTFTYAAYPTVAAAHEAGYATMNYGLFFQNIIDFIIIAFCIFCVIRAIAKAKEQAEAKAKAEAEAKAAAEAAAKAAEPPAETVEDILKDIRAALKK
ncbi:MAG: large conductance mechanosensitive channel protein MscL [Spirochaetia bacterium]|nr:large conductance mechanosensitive channel protein MscL [Spirochaetia bacterium]